MLSNLALVAFGVAVAFGLGEVAVRLLDVPPRMLESLSYQAYVLSENPILQIEFKPGYRDPGDVPGGNAQFRGFEINSDGFRDREFPKQKAPGAIRVLVLGDSITAGNWISDVSKTYPRVLGELLAADPGGTSYEVLNLGVGGYNTLQEAELLRVKGLELEPDIVIVGFCMNDVGYVDGGIYQFLSTRARSDEGIRVSDVYGAGRRWYSGLLRHSRLLFVAYHRLAAALGGEQVDVAFDDGVVTYDDPVAAGLELLDRLREQGSFDVYLFVIPAFDRRFSAYRHRQIHREVARLAARHPQVRFVDLLPDFAAVDARGRVFSADGLHPNEYGQRVLAELIHRKVDWGRGRPRAEAPGS